MNIRQLILPIAIIAGIVGIALYYRFQHKNDTYRIAIFAPASHPAIPVRGTRHG